MIVPIPGAGNRIAAVAAGSEHCLALAAEATAGGGSTLYAWGGFREGQLGMGSVSTLAEDEEKTWEPQIVDGPWKAPIFRIGARMQQSYAISLYVNRKSCSSYWQRPSGLDTDIQRHRFFPSMRACT